MIRLIAARLEMTPEVIVVDVKERALSVRETGEKLEFMIGVQRIST